MTGPALPPGYRLIERDSVGSTNDEARALVASGAPAGIVVWAHSQTAGRGRQGRQWASPPGNLYCSIILRPPIDVARLAEMSFVAALAVRDTVTAILPRAVVSLKWPNDVLVDGRKIAGILVEAEKLPGEAHSALVVGIGINLASAPREAEYPAISAAALGQAAKPAATLAALVANLDRCITIWNKKGFLPIRDEWISHAHGIGTEIAASGGINGRFAGLDESGAILISMADGQTRRVVSGSIRYL